MHGTNLERSIRLLKHLAVRPADIPRYLMTSLSPRNPVELGLPWIAYAAIDFLSDRVQSNFSVAEFGGGGSTVFFAKRVRHVRCIESNEGWAAKIEDKLRQLCLDNVTLAVYPSYDPDDVQGFASSEFLTGLGKDSYDLILVDCLDTSAKLRPLCFKVAERHVKEGGYIVVDDSWRYTGLRNDNRAQSWKEFRSAGPCRVGVTTTDVYFY